MFLTVWARQDNNLREDELLVHAKKLVVKERNLLVNRPKLATIVQDEDEPFYKFETRLKPIAKTGKFHQKCVKCNVVVDSGGRGERHPREVRGRTHGCAGRCSQGSRRGAPSVFHLFLCFP